MKALFLAGDRGIRLQPLTDKVPKPMVPIMNKPLLERTMVHLKKSGISEIVISSCYKPEYIQDYFGNGKQLGLKIQYAAEDIALGTGGAIRNAAAHFSDTFIVFNSDILSDCDIQKMLDYHKSRHALATIAVTDAQDTSAYGVIESDTEGYAASFVERPKKEQNTSNFIDAGIYIFEPEIFDQIPSNSVVSVERETLPKLLANGHKIAVYKDNSYWIDMRTHENYMQVHQDIMDRKCKIGDKKLTIGNISLGKNVKIHPNAKIIGPACIGDNVEIGEGAIITRSVIGNNVSIGRGSRVTGSILWDNIVLSSEVRLLKCIVTSNCFINQNLNYLNSVYANTINLRKAPVTR